MAKNLINSFLRSWRNHLVVQTATFLVLTSSFTILTLFLIFGSNIRAVLTTWGKSIELSVFLKDGVDAATTQSLEDQLKGIDDFQEVRFVSKESANQDFLKQMSIFSSDLLKDSEFVNSFPASFSVAFKSESLVSKIPEWANQIKLWKGVEDVSYGQDWISNYSRFFGIFTKSIWLVALILIFSALLVVGNAIRASVVQHREEIEILDLLGATRKAIIFPFVFNGLLTGLISGVLGLSIAYVFYSWTLNIVTEDLSYLGLGGQLTFLSVWTISLVILTSCFLGALGSYLSVSRLVFRSQVQTT